VLRICSSDKNGVNQVTYIFLECIIPVWAFRGGVAGEIKHTNCWQSKCVLKYCAIFYTCLRIYWKWLVWSIHLGVWTHQIVSETSGVQTLQ